MNLLLKGLTWVQDLSPQQGDVRIKRGLIHEIGSSLTPSRKEHVINFSHHFLYPGLINAHDHLEMNLYPRLGNPPYGNYTQWGNEIYKPQESPVKEIECVDIHYRLLWGGIKNLISGVTTVVHHNPWKRALSSKKFPVKVLEKYTWSHSLSFGKDLAKSFPKKNIPFVIHAAEGIDELAFSEIQKLNQLGVLKSNTVLIHAVALRDADIDIIKQSGASVVWCPASNLFLFNQTTPLEKLKNKIPVALGSDSTLTGSTTLLEEMQVALGTGLASAEEIVKQVTRMPAEIFNLHEPVIRVGSKADLLILPAQQNDYYKNIVNSKSSDIEMITVDGEIALTSESIAKEINLKKPFATIQGSVKWICVDVPGLKTRIKKVTGNVVEANPLWQLIG